MKIDLHVHTKKIAQGEPETRNTTSNDFKDKMIEAGVRIVAITNHYELDLEQYNEFKNEFKDEEDDYIILPGVELDIFGPSGDKVQANIIAHPDDASKLYDKLKLIDNKTNRIKYEDLLKNFDNEKWIIYLDYKNSGNTSWSPENMRKAMCDFKHSLVITDTNKATTLQVLNANNFTALIGSDVTDWDNYISESDKLLFTHFKIESYDIFWRILKNDLVDSHTIFSKISSKTFDNLKMEGSGSESDHDYVVNGITIKDGVNIFMGPKRTGKSMILKEINKRERNSIYYESANKEKNIEELKKILMDDDFFNNFKTKINAILEDLVNYDDVKFNKFYDFYKHVDSKTKVNFHNKWNINLIDISKNPEVRKQISLLEETRNALKTTCNNLKDLNIENKKWLKESKIVADQLWRDFKKIHIENWKEKFRKSIKDGLDDLLKNNNGTNPKPISVGLFERYNSKNNFRLNLEELVEIETISSKNIKKYNVPGRSNVQAKQNIIIPDVINGNNSDKFKNKKGKINAIIKSIKNHRLNPFIADVSKVVETLQNFKEDSDYWIEEVVISDSNGNVSFSNGEKAHMLLDEELSKNVEYYILDEPAVFLSKESIIDFLLPKISDLVKSRKKIVIATHNSSIGLNTIPINYVYRKYDASDECKSYIGSVWEKKFVNVKDKKDTLTFAEEIMGNFEGSAEHFKFRKEIYEEN